MMSDQWKPSELSGTYDDQNTRSHPTQTRSKCNSDSNEIANIRNPNIGLKAFNEKVFENESSRDQGFQTKQLRIKNPNKTEESNPLQRQRYFRETKKGSLGPDWHRSAAIA